MTKLIKIYGERNTNTNYMSRLIQLNLNIEEIPGVAPPYIRKLQRALPGKECVRDMYFYLTYRKNLGWKHTCAKTEDELRKYKVVNTDLVFLTITKNPYSWLLSLYRKPYHQYYAKKQTFESFLQHQWRTIGRDNIKTDLKNPIELWNIKNKSYLRLNNDNTVRTKTEDIFKDPRAIIDNISERHAVEKKSEKFINHFRSTKDKKKTFAYYRDYYLSEKWREDLSPAAIAIINKHLDKDLMDYYKYEILSC
ncbi:hypothetical protein [Lacimicrobium alkaliphilum]|uniref:Sulfotransferase domain-containing protein n=1 Tax=Lacimicrobium alkaliphilum TaxID=1526571 RepID=A0A0U3AKG6_9ALTE|nr:hypothetical protein [Lacimicrobium alkaliphilum]ALS99249.1 hypothetical protein AT746_13945 [Lacimicrobium alkaliphilum]